MTSHVIGIVPENAVSTVMVNNATGSAVGPGIDGKGSFCVVTVPEKMLTPLAVACTVAGLDPYANPLKTMVLSDILNLLCTFIYQAQ